MDMQGQARCGGMAGVVTGFDMGAVVGVMRLKGCASAETLTLVQAAEDAITGVLSGERDQT